ncbi:MAG: thiamine pyrophosphate-dependent enzyme [Bacteroidota bacterium]|nr:thiamine pyrophosphate-dependent enzyme [Bacteroidota bacterium]
MQEKETAITFDIFKKEVLTDYATAFKSRHTSLIGRKEVLTGKAKFGIFGDGKEVAQLAMARVFKNGDFRSGYYRDQTFMFAIGELTIQEFFAQLYAEPSVEAEPSSAGRSMNGHFGTRFLDDNGNWKNLTELKNSTSDISPTASQMSRVVGLGYASKLFRNNINIQHLTQFSDKGNEVAFATIGNASTSEGGFFEAINAMGVLQVPVVVSVWDDGYGISVPAKYQTTKESISEILKGFQRDDQNEGYNIYRVKGWDYAELCRVYEDATKIAREKHIPAIIHVEEMTQPQGHSTSGSHERYKTKERLQWEQDFDCVKKMREWILTNSIATPEELEAIETAGLQQVKDEQKASWQSYLSKIKADVTETILCLEALANVSDKANSIKQAGTSLLTITEPTRRDIFEAIFTSIQSTVGEQSPERNQLLQLLAQYKEVNKDRYNSHLYSQSSKALGNIEQVEAIYSEESKNMDGREILQACFDKAFERIPELFAIGEDVGRIGDVNQGFAGLQDKYGELRITDTGIREWTITGQGIGAAMRGLRPIVEIQYLDYFLYALQILSDDVATLQYRTKGGQKCPLIIRTRGHRLEGIWHSGSPMGMILNGLRGMNILVPRNMTQAAAYYNTLLLSDEPALVVECLNGYRLKEKMPDNIGEITLVPGLPEVLKQGTDITLVTYGSCCRIAMEAAQKLETFGIYVEIVDVQSLLPFDTKSSIVESLKKTGQIVFFDEDVPGGASAFMMQQVLEIQGGYQYLDAPPLTITAQAHRPAYGTDGDFFSKPQANDVFEALYQMMHQYAPGEFPPMF